MDPEYVDFVAEHAYVDERSARHALAAAQRYSNYVKSGDKTKADRAEKDFMKWRNKVVDAYAKTKEGDTYSSVAGARDTINFDTIYGMDDWQDDLFVPAPPVDVNENDLGNILFEGEEISKDGAMRRLEKELFADGDPTPEDLGVLMKDYDGYKIDDIGAVLFNPLTEQEMSKREKSRKKSFGNMDMRSDYKWYDKYDEDKKEMMDPGERMAKVVSGMKDTKPAPAKKAKADVSKIKPPQLALPKAKPKTAKKMMRGIPRLPGQRR